MRRLKSIALGVISVGLLSCRLAVGQSAATGAGVVEDLGEVKAQLKSPDANVRWNAVATLEKASSPEAGDLLVQELDDYGMSSLHGIVAGEAIVVAGKRKETKAVEPLIKILLAGSRTVRINGRKTMVDNSQTAAQALGEIGDDRATDPLIAALQAEITEGMRAGFTNDWCCAQALGKIGNPKSVDIIVLALRATSKTVTRYTNRPPLVATGYVVQERRYYYSALQNIHAPECTLALLKMIADPPLANYGTLDVESAGFILKTQKDRPAIKQLIDLLTKFESEPVSKDDGDQLRLKLQKEACAEALANITGQSTFDIDIAAWKQWYAANTANLPPQLSLDSPPLSMHAGTPSTLPSTRPAQLSAEAQAAAKQIREQIEQLEKQLSDAAPGSPERMQLAQQILDLRKKLDSSN